MILLSAILLTLCFPITTERNQGPGRLFPFQGELSQGQAPELTKPAFSSKLGVIEKTDRSFSCCSEERRGGSLCGTAGKKKQGC